MNKTPTDEPDDNGPTVDFRGPTPEETAWQRADYEAMPEDEKAKYLAALKACEVKRD